MHHELHSELAAIVGIACRFPGANDYNQYWQNLEQGINSISEIPPQRWDVEKYYSPNPEIPNKTISKWAGLIEDIDKFDAQFFGISPREAGKVDPQHRIMLELSWSCIEDAGYSPSQLSGKDVGVFMGACNYDSILLMNRNQDNVEGHSGTGTWTCMIPNRISSFFNLHGPSLPIDTACSSSLVAIHYALKSLKESECEMALVGGLSVLFTSTTYIQMSQLGMLSPTGQCRTFSSDADGYVRGEGAGVVLLKPLTKAIEDGDRIYGVIQGSAINHGGKARTITSPNVYSQAQVIRAAYTKANISPNTVSYIESHGTGTPLGDPIEINALKRAYRQLDHQYGVEKTEKPYCGIGAVKSNIGHLEGAAGIAGLIKVLLAMKYKKLPKIVNFKELNPRINIKDTPFYFIEETQEWKRLKNESGEEIPRRAGLSSFGIGGVNAHIVLEEPQEEVKVQNLKVKSDIPGRPQQILTLSAKTEKALRELATKYQTYLQSKTELSIQNICFSANTGRTHFSERLAIVAESKSDLQQKLADFLQDNETTGVLRGKAENHEKEIAFLFTGQGSQYVDMGRQLYETQPTFQKILDQCNEILKEYVEVPLLEVLYPKDPQKSSISLLDQTAYTQPALFAVEYALFKLWESWGIKPSVVMGHSVGEYVAATVAGVLSLEDGLKLIAERGRLMQQLPPGGEMVSLMASESQVKEAIKDYNSQVTIAAINGPESIVISGESGAIATICSKLEAMGVKTKQLQVSHAFHSPLMEPMLAKFETVAKEVTYNQPKIPLISNVTGEKVGVEITTAEYWVNHVSQPVRFAQSMKTLNEQGYEVFLEIGPKPILLGMGKQCVAEDVGLWLPSLRPPKKDWQQILESLGQLYVKGVKVNWLGFEKDYAGQKVALPTYPFQRQRYWLDIQKNGDKKVGSLSIKNYHSQPIDSLSKDNQNNSEQQNLIIEERDKFMLTKTSRRREKIIAEISEIIAQELGFEDSSQVDIHNNLLEMGADSLTLMAAGRKVEKNYGINITIRQFFEELTDVDALAKYIDEHLSPEWEQQSKKGTSRRREKIIAEISEIIAQELGFEDSSQVDIHNNLLEMGADSLTLMAAGRKVEKNYGINITIRQFFEELTDVDALAKYIDDHLSPEWGEEETAQKQYLQQASPKVEEMSLPQAIQKNREFTTVKPEIPGDSTALEKIMQQQLQVMSQQLQVLQGRVKYTNQTSVLNNGHSHQRVDRESSAPRVEVKPESTKPSAQLRQEDSRVSFGKLSPSNYIRTPVEIEQQLNKIIPELIVQADLDSYREIPTELENLSVDYIVQAFKEMGWSYKPGESFSLESVVQKLGVISDQQRLFKRLLEILAEEGILQSTQQEWQVLQTLEGANPKEKSQKLLSQYPNAQAELTLLHRCASELSGVLQGKSNPLQLVFPEGDLTTATQLYQESPPAQAINNIIQRAIAIAIEKLPASSGVRLLEIGAGTGGTTSYILPHLNPSKSEYVFTDIGGFFNVRAKEKFQDYPYVSYQTLDIEKNPKNQGFESHSYDVIIASNVLHATTYMSETLSHVRQLLAPGGMLVLWEKTAPQRWLDLIFGLLGGWQKFRDLDLRPDSPLLNQSQWKQLLRESGFPEVVILPNSDQILNEAVIIAQAESNQKKEKISATSSSRKVALSEQQKSYLEKFIGTYTSKTKKSKQRAINCRPVMADKRTAVGFRVELKEIKYPIIGESSSGSRIWDIDGNEYIDVCMGFGVHLFGHQPQFIIEALQNQLKQGIQIGPQAKLAGEVAQLVHELTGMERVAFSNSGTEAVMTAVRLARLATGRDKIVIFDDSYHGQFDGVLAMAGSDDNYKSSPVLPGILQRMVDDVIVLSYGTAQSLEVIKTYAHELAAVIVEPVQSRRLDLQPKEFLQQLRQFTKESSIPLIFDEVVTGFRIHQGGSQAWFGIEADIATYGKCVGGGTPIGMIAGKAIYMDGIDGGQWYYGDDSYPQKLQTFFAGTFNKNPLSMAAARAVMQHLKTQGPALQENLNQRASKLVTAMNAYFEQEDVPIKMVNFGAVFRLVPSGNYSYKSQPIGLDLLFYKLIEKGVYMWEGRNGPACFISTAHTDKDIDYIISAVKESISEMRQGGFFPKKNQQNSQINVKQPERVRGAL